MTVKELYRFFTAQLQCIYDPGEASAITDLTFEKILSLKRADILKDPPEPLNPASIAFLDDALHQLLQHKPLQYVLGETWFYKIKLTVNENVLIPRPETEELVEWIINENNTNQSGISILDIGTGSGCIPIAIKKNMPTASIAAIDLSEKALEVAKQNGVLQHTDIHFLQLDFLDEQQWDLLPLFDVIISNPPYIPTREKNTLAKNVLAYEPHSALFVADETPLIFYEKIALFGKAHLQPGGSIYLETHEDHARDVLSVFKLQYPRVEIKKDLFGKERMVKVSTGY
jgi:release factor glutamine methyltransferase